MPVTIDWKPNPKQEEFLRLPDTIQEALYGGAAGGGKSEVLILLPLARGWFNHPRFKGIIFRRTYPELESEIIVRSNAFYPAAGAKYSTDKKRWIFPSGAIMQFGHMEYESDARKYDSAEYNYIAFDELTSFTKFQYTYLFSRSRSSTPELPAIIRSATNPGNVGHGWVRSRFVTPAPYGHVMHDKVTQIKRIFIQAKLSDNKHIDASYASKLGILSEAERRAKLDGDWDTYEGQVFDEYREEPLSDEPSYARHIYQPFNIPKWWPKFAAIDWGFKAMTIVLWAALSPEGRIYVYREYSCKEQKVSTWATEFKGLNDLDDNLIDVTLCASAWQDRGQSLTIAQEFEKHSGIVPIRPENDRIAGKQILQEALRWKAKPQLKRAPDEHFSSEIAQLILRNNGIKAYESYVASYLPPEPEINLPKLQISVDCKEVRATIPLCVYAKPENSTGKPSEDVAEFPGDDPYDCLRYLAKRIFTYVDTSSEGEQRKQLQVSKAIEELEKTQDQTRYYAKMAKIERENHSSVRPVRRFGRLSRNRRVA